MALKGSKEDSGKRLVNAFHCSIRLLKETVEALLFKTFKNGLTNVIVDPALGRWYRCTF